MSYFIAAAIAGSALQTLQGISSAKMQSVSYKMQGLQYDLQAEQMDIQKQLLTDRYRTQRQLLTGDAVARAAASGVKINGSVADSISQSLTELGIEEAWQKYNVSLNQAEARYNAAMSRASAKAAKKAGGLNAFASLLGTAARFSDYWAGENAKKSPSIVGRGDD